MGVSNGGCACRTPSGMRLARGWPPVGGSSTYNIAMVAQQRTRQTATVNQALGRVQGLQAG
jgi:hypothetical protein